MNDLRSKLGYGVGSPWENAPYNLINTNQGKITMSNTKKRLKAYDAKTGKFLSDLIPGNEYQFPTNQILEIPAYQEGGWNINKLFKNKNKQPIVQNQFGIYSGIVDYNGKVNYNPTSDEVIKNMAEFMKNNLPPESSRPSNNYRPQWQHYSFDIPRPYVNNFAQLGGYLQEGGDYDPTQDQQKGMSIVPIKVNDQIVGGTGAQQTYYNTQPQPSVQPQNKTITTRGFSPAWFKGVAAVNFGLSAFANSVEEGRQAAWNQKQMNNPLFNGSYSFAQNDYGVNPYEQTGQIKKYQKGGKFNAYDFLYGDDREDEDVKPEPKATNETKKKSRITDEEVNNLSQLGLSPEDIVNSVTSYRNFMKNKASTLSGQFQSFNSPEEGRQALLNQLNLYQTGKTKTGLKPTSSLYEAMAKYAPSSDNNNPKAYAEFIAKKLNIPATTPISQVDPNQWANAITQMEGNKKGNNPGNLKKFQKGGYYVVDFATLKELQSKGVKYKLLNS